MKGLLVLVLVSVCSLKSLPLFGQEVSWASSIAFSKNEFSATTGSASHVLGAPDAQPYGQASDRAYRMHSTNGYGRIVVGFDKAVEAKQVFIFENYLPGRIHKVIAYEISGRKHLLYDGGFKLSDPYRILKISLSDNSIPIEKIEVNLLAYYDEGLAEIDAIGISSSDDPSLADRLATQYGISSVPLEGTLVDGISRVNLDVEVNSKYAEVKPIVSVEGNTLYFSRQNHPDNIGASKDEQDIYVSTKHGDKWSKAQNIGAPINNNYPNGIVALTADGLGMYLINEYTEDGSYKKGLSFSSKRDGKWTKPTPVRVKGLYNFSNYVDYTIAASGEVMILAMKRIDSRGEMDLYVSFNEGNHVWSTPKNIGKTVNSTADDFAPFLAPDGETLYFSSYGHGGFGDADIFISRRLDDSWQNWSKPENLGPDINSKGFDGYFTIPGTGPIAYMVSDQGSIGNSRDIFEVIVQAQHLPKQSLQVVGQLIDKRSNQPIAGSIILKEGKQTLSEAFSLQEDGTYKSIIQANKNYILYAESEGYLPAQDQLHSGKFVDGVLVKNIFLEPIEPSDYSHLTASATDDPGIAGNTFRNFTQGGQEANAPKPHISLRTVNAKTSQAIAADLQDIAEFERLDAFSFLLQQPDKHAIFKVQKEGYLSWQGSLASLKAIDGIYTVPLHPFDEETQYPIEHLLFHQGLAELLIQAVDPLAELSTILHSNPEVMVSLHGHTDAIGDPKANQELSEARVKKIKGILVERGIDEHRIQTIGYGGSKPMASNAHESTRRLNRRVEYSLHLPKVLSAQQH